MKLATKLGAIRPPVLGRELADIHGSPEARGATINGVQVHSLRLPGYIVSVEAIFGQDSERLSIRHDAGESAEPYVAGTLLATRQVIGKKGLIQGFDTLLFPEPGA